MMMKNRIQSWLAVNSYTEGEFILETLRWYLAEISWQGVPKSYSTRKKMSGCRTTCWCCSESGQVFSIGTVVAYSAKYSALVAYRILELFQY